MISKEGQIQRGKVVGHFAQDMLGLSDCHAITGDDDDLFSLTEQEGGVFG